MRLLLDTHALLWWGNADPRLGTRAAAELDSGRSEVFVSAVSAIEVATKFRLGKLPEAWKLAEDFEGAMDEMGLNPLAISLHHANTAGGLKIAHRDPFDRLLIAQAMIENLTLVSNEKLFDGFGVARLW